MYIYTYIYLNIYIYIYIYIFQCKMDYNTLLKCAQWPDLIR